MDGFSRLGDMEDDAATVALRARKPAKPCALPSSAASSAAVIVAERPRLDLDRDLARLRLPG